MTRAHLPGIIAMAAIVVASNILVQHLFGNWLTWGAFTYPLAFLVTDVMNRVYGAGPALTVGFVGSLKPRHGLAHLVAAIAQHYNRVPQARLLIVGDGPQRADLVAELQRRRLQLGVERHTLLSASHVLQRQ